jgi:hypothetical protein
MKTNATNAGALLGRDHHEVEELPEFDGEDVGWARVAVDDLGLNDGLHIHSRPIAERADCRCNGHITNEIPG